MSWCELTGGISQAVPGRQLGFTRVYEKVALLVNFARLVVGTCATLSALQLRHQASRNLVASA